MSSIGDILILTKHTSATYWEYLCLNKNKVAVLESTILQNASVDDNFLF